MKNVDILLLANTLPSISPPDMDRWFNYAVQETINRATSTAKIINEVIKPKEKMIEYNKKLKELQLKHTHRDEFGDPVKHTNVINGREFEVFDISEINNPKGAFNVATNKLNEEYKEAIKEYNDGLTFLEEENEDFEPYWVTIDQIPNGLTRNEMKAVFLMVEKPKK